MSRIHFPFDPFALPGNIKTIHEKANVPPVNNMDLSRDKPYPIYYLRPPYRNDKKVRLIMKKTYPLLLVLALSGVCISPEIGISYTISTDSIYKHISILASDSLEGREAGEPGEWKAARYIISVFRTAGLEPKGNDSSYLQPFGFVKKIDCGERNRLSVNGVELKPLEEFLPMKQSASMTFEFDNIVPVDYGITVEGSTYDDYEGKNVENNAVLIKRHAPSSEDNPHIDFSNYGSITDKIARAIDHKVKGIIFYTPEGYDDTIITVAGALITPKSIPIIWLRRNAIERLGLDPATPELKSVAGETDLIRVRDTGYNVIGYVPTANDTTIIIGAHYDHLGYGGPTSRYQGKEKKIHYGADDNASGVAALLELARHYSAKRNQLKYSHLFIAFSGEEKGLLGSSHFVRHMTIDSDKVRMMANMDMIGRLRDQDEGLIVFGVGTCEQFKNYFDSVLSGDLKVTFKESGVGGSDQTAFNNHSIPALHFFTGAHADYHTPRDVIDKIDLEGIVRAAGFLDKVISYFDKFRGDLIFLRTRSEGRPHAAYSVTLGIMPDYVAEVRGLRVDAVSPERPAERAGVLKGDVIIRMGRLVVDDIYTYMNALSKFRNGDTTTVTVERGADTLNLLVEFK